MGGRRQWPSARARRRRRRALRGGRRPRVRPARRGLWRAALARRHRYDARHDRSHAAAVRAEVRRGRRALLAARAGTMGRQRRRRRGLECTRGHVRGSGWTSRRADRYLHGYCRRTFEPVPGSGAPRQLPQHRWRHRRNRPRTGGHRRRRTTRRTRPDGPVQIRRAARRGPGGRGPGSATASLATQRVSCRTAQRRRGVVGRRRDLCPARRCHALAVTRRYARHHRVESAARPGGRDRLAQCQPGRPSHRRRRGSLPSRAA